MYRVVLDTNILVAGLRSSNGASAEVLRQARHGNLILAATPSLFLEYEDVLKRPEHLLATGLTAAQIDMFLGALALLIEPVDLNFRWRPQLADPDDEMFLEAAVNGRADALITFNSRHFVEVAKMFGLSLWQPRELLRRMRNG
jgi:putative PIN family toxin of toxin-antitoxin system